VHLPQPSAFEHQALALALVPVRMAARVPVVEQTSAPTLEPALALPLV
jgi:hypothetical protein